MPYSGGGGSSFTGGTISTPLLIPDGAVGAPSVGFTSDADGSGTGLYRTGSDAMAITANGAAQWIFFNGQTRMLSSELLGWSSGAPTTALDTILTREGAAIVQMGSDVNGAPVAQTIKSHDGITGTDIAGANLTVAGGRGTGAGAGGDLRFQTAPVLSTGTTAQVLNDRDVIIAKSKTLPDNSATAFVTIALPAGGMCGGVIEYAIMASNGTDHQCRAGVIPFAIVNKADAETATLGTVGAATEVVALSTGTLANTFTSTVGSNSLTVNATADSSLNVSSTINYKVRINGNVSAITVTPA